MTEVQFLNILQNDLLAKSVFYQSILCSVAFRSYFISVIEEPSLSIADKAELRHEQNLLAEYTRREGCDFKEFTHQKAR